MLKWVFWHFSPDHALGRVSTVGLLSGHIVNVEALLPDCITERCWRTNLELLKKFGAVEHSFFSKFTLNWLFQTFFHSVNNERVQGADMLVFGPFVSGSCQRHRALCRIAWETLFQFLSATNIDKRSRMQIREKKKGCPLFKQFWPNFFSSENSIFSFNWGQ